MNRQIYLSNCQKKGRPVFETILLLFRKNLQKAIRKPETNYLKFEPLFIENTSGCATVLQVNPGWFFFNAADILDKLCRIIFINL